MQNVLPAQEQDILNQILPIPANTTKAFTEHTEAACRANCSGECSGIAS